VNAGQMLDSEGNVLPDLTVKNVKALDQLEQQKQLSTKISAMSMNMQQQKKQSSSVSSKSQ
jgi:hypothetical protein